ncbi:asparagine synthase (glutamine-hydrolyzing) [Tepidicaulis sp.]|uniref:asparagine synthase (glutamine-hydrolyzing) n=1 Tax=Tepidicaulis sp. TaxID=1920809 RepID=UPI003B5CCE8B
MCGIAGYFNWHGKPADITIAQRMGERLSHRGPDGNGAWAHENVALSHQRLSILDLSDAARQPMQSEDGRYTLIYNGEVYNFLELRAFLQARGHRFHSDGDTEVVLHALAEWGVEAFKRLNGMFALALWDNQEKTLLLARDRYGIKPLYYSVQSGCLAFGSEIKALLAHPSIAGRLDLAGLREYLTFQNFLSSRTLFEKVQTLPAGSFAYVRSGDAKAIKPERYWSFKFMGGMRLEDEREAIERVGDAFSLAVSRQLIADVEVGGYLSGGLDSGAIVAHASKILPHMRTFTCGFDLSSASGMELFFDERRDAEMMSARFDTEHYEMVLKAGDMERVMPALVRCIEEPRVGQSYPNYFIASLAAKFNKVVLAGTGGDELFGGYPWRYEEVLDLDKGRFAEKLFNYWQRVIPADSLASVMAPVWSNIKGDDPREVFEHHFSRIPGGDSRDDRLNSIMTFEAQTFLPGLLAVEDKVSMSHGLEVRLPFLDNDLVDLCQELPVGLKLGQASILGDRDKAKNSAGRTNEGKRILREALRGQVPDEVLGRAKQGFSAPDASWFKGQSIEYVRNKICSEDAKLYEVLSFKNIYPLIEQHLTGNHNRRLMIWSLLALEETFKEFDLV